MNALSTFSFHAIHDVRVVIINNEPWFVAADVCAALKLANTSMAIQSLDGDEKGVSSIDTLGGKQNVNIVNESGMYALVMRNRNAMKEGTPQHRFRKWVTSEVLPTIRKTGSYSLPKPVEKRDYMTNSDMLNIKRLIYSLTNGTAYKTSCSNAIWAALRQVTGVPSPAKFEVQHISVVAHELGRIYGVLHSYVEARRNIEQELIKRIIRDHEDAQRILPVLFGMMSAAIQEERAEVHKNWDKLFVSWPHKFVPPL